MRWRVRSILTACFLFLFVGTLVAQEDARSEQLPAARDGFPIHITYYPVGEDQNPMNAPVVVLLHDAEGSRLQWDKASGPRGQDPFPVALQKKGYAVITVDLRKHGESVVPSEMKIVVPQDYPKMVLGDLVAVKRFIYEQHQDRRLNMRKMGIVAVGMSAPIAAAFAEVDWRQTPYDDAPIAAQRTPRGQDVRLLAFLSPRASSGTVHAAKSLSYLKNPRMEISLLVIVGDDDADGKSDANRVHQIFASNKRNEERVAFLTPPLKDSGLALMTKPMRFAYQPLQTFLDNHLQNLNSPWQDRRSRLER